MYLKPESILSHLGLGGIHTLVSIIELLHECFKTFTQRSPADEGGYIINPTEILSGYYKPAVMHEEGIYQIMVMSPIKNRNGKCCSLLYLLIVISFINNHTYTVLNKSIIPLPMRFKRSRELDS